MFTIPAGALSPGVNTLTVSYSGDAVYAQGSGTATVTVSPVVIAVTSPSPVVAGGNGTATVTLTAGSSYSGTVNLSCTLSNSPANAQSPPTCNVNPASPTVAAGGNVTATLTLKTTGATSAKLAPQRNLWGPAREGLVLAVVLLIGLRARRRRWISTLGLLFFSLAVLAVGCGGSHKSGPSSQPTTAGTYVFTVTATDSKNALIAAPATASLTVQ